jgi:hypothetical protein
MGPCINVVSRVIKIEKHFLQTNKHLFEHLYIVPQNASETAPQNDYFFLRCIFFIKHNQLLI